MNNYCRNCGTKLDSGCKECPKCKTEVLEDRIVVEDKKIEIEERIKKEDNIFYSILGLFGASILLGALAINSELMFLGAFQPLTFLAGLITLIYAKISYPKSLKIKILFYVVMTLVILYIIFIILVIVACYNAIQSC